jgi:homoprotocatechuate degradation regulator HpaR
MSSNPRYAGLRAHPRTLPMALLLSHDAVMRRFRPALSAFDLTEQQWHVLQALISTTQVEIRDLAHTTCLEPTKLSRILKDLEDRGLVERRRSGRDMRLKLAAISSNGILLIDQLRPIAEEISIEIANSYGGARVGELMELLRELTAKLDEGSPTVFDETEPPRRRSDDHAHAS